MIFTTVCATRWAPPTFRFWEARALTGKVKYGELLHPQLDEVVKDDDSLSTIIASAQSQNPNPKITEEWGYEG